MAGLDPAGLVSRCADPEATSDALDRLARTHHDLRSRLEDGPRLGRAVVAVVAASRSMAVTLERDPVALDRLTTSVGGGGPGAGAEPPSDDAGALAAWVQRELVAVAAADLTGEATFEATVAAISAVAARALEAAVVVAGAEGLAVIGMGKLGGGELNYASDVDLVLVGADDLAPTAAERRARAVVDVAGRCFRVDLALRPEGRDGRLVRTVESHRAYWDRWAEPWEFQALMRARPVAGDGDLGRAYAAAAAEAVWQPRLGATEIRALRHHRARAEEAARAAPGSEDELKVTPGGIRDVEFPVQLLQLVHGPHDPTLRARSTLAALVALAGGGYVARGDAEAFGDAYRFLRRIEHVAQLADQRPAHRVPPEPAERDRVARVAGFARRAGEAPGTVLSTELAACRATVRGVQQRWYFRPLLEAFESLGGPLPDPASTSATLPSEAVAARATALGFSDVVRTRTAVRELTRGLTRSSRLMHQLLPLLLDWLSATPSPEQGLAGLCRLADHEVRARWLAGAFRESPEVARRLCTALGTSSWLVDGVARHPDLITEVGTAESLGTLGTDRLEALRRGLGLRHEPAARRRALRHLTGREGTRIGMADVIGLADHVAVGRSLSDLASSAVAAATEVVATGGGLAVIGLGRLGGRELSYASDLDLVVLRAEGTDGAEADRAVATLRTLLAGSTPAEGIYDVDLDLRPEGRDGPLTRTIAGYVTHLERWAETWERQVLLRARPVAGDAELAAGFLEAVHPLVHQGLSAEQERSVRRMKARIEAERLPAGEDPSFHLKLGPGGLVDVEFCVQFLQLRHQVAATDTAAAIDALETRGVLAEADAAALRDAYGFCQRTRNRWFLVRGRASDALPLGEDLGRLAWSLGSTPVGLREDYRRVTRRARRVVETTLFPR